MTPLSQPVHRRCSGILDDKQRPLDVTLNDHDGGSLFMKWKGTKGEPVEVSLRELMDFAEGRAEMSAPATPAKGGGLDPGRLLSVAHVIGEYDYPVRLAVIALVKDLVLHHEWISSGTDVSWETWKKNHTETPE